MRESLEARELADEGEATLTLTLPFDARQKSRLRATLDDGRELRLFLPRGTVLRDGDRLRTTSGLIVAVRAADETVSTVLAPAAGLVRAAYHLGNRHVALQIGGGWLRYQHDHVLDDMVRGLGYELRVELAPFEPEPGAYAHSHEHAHSSDDHAHSPSDSHSSHEHAHSPSSHEHAHPDDHERAHPDDHEHEPVADEQDSARDQGAAHPPRDPAGGDDTRDEDEPRGHR